jgi:hypothetical protein
MLKRELSMSMITKLTQRFENVKVFSEFLLSLKPKSLIPSDYDILTNMALRPLTV